MPALLPLAAMLWLAPVVPPTADVLKSWSTLNAASLEIGTPGSKDTLRCEFELLPGSDVRIQVTDKRGGTTTSGTLMLVAGHLLVHDYPVVPGKELDVPDACGLSIQLVNQLLALGAGVPPTSIRGTDDIALLDNQTTLHLESTSARADVPLPWSVRGTATSVETGVVSFDLVHATAEGEARFVGTWERRTPAPALPDDTPLAGWRLFRIEPKGDTLGATPVKKPYATVGALRASVSGASPAPSPSGGGPR